MILCSLIRSIPINQRIKKYLKKVSTFEMADFKGFKYEFIKMKSFMGKIQIYSCTLKSEMI